MALKNFSVAVRRFSMDCLILCCTSGCVKACSGVTSYGRPLEKTENKVRGKHISYLTQNVRGRFNGSL